ncbi:MAG TPA: Gfo/Idh/MocA family oxidoreductase [Blastocatellia bacterium]|nr:Gfo/Idh/MocA family oxidoreductase [Blastocatellia bacterium]
MPETLADDYGLSKTQTGARIEAPALPYQPQNPKRFNPEIGVIGCGGIATQHLNAYRHAGFRVTGLCDHTKAKACAYQEKFYPDAFITTDYGELLRRDEIEVVDITTYPEDRVEIIEEALAAGKHVLSQKPFVVDLDVGERLADLADARGVRLAVNQNGRWAPHFSFIRQALKAGLIGRLMSASFNAHWDHNWIIGTKFEEIESLVLYDFGVHWFDLAAHFFEGREALRVSAFATRASGQRAKPPMLAQAIIEFEEGQASIVFNANVEHGQEDRTVIAGTEGTIISAGPSLSEQSVTIYTAEGHATPALEGTWFREGFHGAMAELLCAIEEGRAPVNNARDNLRGLGLCFAAIAGAAEGLTKIPRSVRKFAV